MTAPCIIRLDHAISISRDEVEKACLLAEKGSYLARIGEYSSAESIRAGLREQFGSGRSLKVSVLLMLLEALLAYFQSLGGDAKDRLLRAQLLSIGSKNRELIALTTAWLGHIQFNEGSIEEAISSARMAIETIEKGQLAASIRVGLLVGDILLTTRQSNDSKNWYSLARDAAVKYGDQAAIGAITYNQATLRAFNLRLEAASGATPDPQAIRLADAEIRSASNYQAVAGVKSLDHLLVGTRVGVDVLSERYTSALVLLNELLQDGEIPEAYPYRSVLLSDAVLCSVKLNEKELAKRYCNQLTGIPIRSLPLDDQIIIFSNLNRVHRTAPELLDSGYVESDVQAMLMQLDERHNALVDGLGPLRDVPEELRW
jgi:tetratricopeptide (TPR) repeat protein